MNQIDLDPERFHRVGRPRIISRKMAAGLLVACSLLASPAGAIDAWDEGEGGFFYNGNRLHELCRSGAAMPYVAGLYDGAQYVLGYAEKGAMPDKFCSPEGSVTTQLRDIVCSYVDDHPEDRTFSAMSLAITALKEAWPCPWGKYQ